MKNKDFYRIAKEYLPDFSSDDIWYIIWNETGYPGFFKGDTETEFRKQLAEFKSNL